tara:strand:+ start:443 stop:733 length:291 start_codon:yes stop_codon:yes gene_type:complete
MNYEKHLEELDKFREILSNTISDLEGLGVEFGNYMAQVEDMRDDYDARSNMDFDDGDHLTNKHKKKYTDKNGDTIIETAEMLDKKKRTQILAGIKR